jgi:osmoprotectant transport system permease protein
MVMFSTISDAATAHIILAYTALFVSIVLGVPLAFASLHSKNLASIVMKSANMAQAVPSFAVVAIVVPLIGIGFWPAVIAIMLRGLLPIIKNTYIGLSTIDTSLIEYAKGIGLTNWEIDRYIRFPNAYPAMFAGIKFAGILANSIAILTAIIGSGGLGELVFEGLIGFRTDLLLAGALPAIVLAMFIDASFTLMEKRLTPFHLRD